MRSLRPHEKALVLDALGCSAIADETVCAEAVERCLLIAHRPSLRLIRGARSAVAYLALRNRASGITLGRFVFVRQDLFDAQGHIPMDLLAHEIAHVVQFLRDGTVPFLWRYLRDYAQGRARGLNDFDAYSAIPYEIEARAVADAVTTTLDHKDYNLRDSSS